MSLNLLLRNPSVFSNVTQETMRKRVGLSFRKKLGVYNYKVKPGEYYKNPHSVDLVLKEQLQKAGGERSVRKLRALERNSIKPYGSFTSKGIFVKDSKKIPNFNIPDLTDFSLKPYVSWGTEKLKDDAYVSYNGMTRELLMETIKEQLKQSSDVKVSRLYNEIFETEEGQKIVEEYLTKLNKKQKLKLTNF